MIACWINGVAGAGVDPTDRGLQYGDGLFETMRVVDGRIRLIDRHLARLRLGCERLSIAPVSGQALRAELDEAAALPGAGVIKLIVTRGAGGRGYRAAAASATNRIVIAYPSPVYAPHCAEHGVALRYCDTVLSTQAALAGLKHLNRLEQVLARNEWADAPPEEGLMLDCAGRVVCGTMTNLFAVIDAGLRTPDVSRCGVAGTMRATVIEAATAAGMPCAIGDLTPGDLGAASELFVTNALIGAWPVATLAGRRYGPGPAVRRVQGWIDAL